MAITIYFNKGCDEDLRKRVADAITPGEEHEVTEGAIKLTEAYFTAVQKRLGRIDGLAVTSSSCLAGTEGTGFFCVGPAQS